MSTVNGRTNLLLVDDRPENLVALQAILEPLGQNLVTARSGEEALKRLLYDDFAAILLDVQMPELDGFETAALIKQREKTRHVPIIFLTAISKDEKHVFRGYSAGAVDYIFKPFDPDVLRSKVSVFIDLYRKNAELERQAELLRRQQLAELQRESEERYRFLAESVPQHIWTTSASGEVDYLNERTLEYFGRTIDELRGPGWWEVVHPDDVARATERWNESIATGVPYEVELRLRGADGVYRWHLNRALPRRDDDGNVVAWFGTNTEIDDRKRAEEARRFLVEAGAILGGSLDYRQSLVGVAQAAVPGIADWCVVDIVEGDTLGQLAVAHADPKKVEFARELQRRYPPNRDADRGAGKVVRTGRSELVAEIPDALLEKAAVDEFHLQLLRELGLRSYMCVPLVAHDHVLGAITFVQAESGRAYDERDLAIAEELGRRAGTAVENAALYEAAEERGRAARVLESVADGVFLVDDRGVIRLWNAGAEAITGLSREEVIGSRPSNVIAGWDELDERIPVASAPGPGATRTETVPVDIGGRELWISISGVGFDEGTVYAFRDLTEERALEEMKTDFVATVSHELRTPLAAIYGAALTIRRTDLELDDEMRNRLLNVIAEESDRLAAIVNDLLLASHLDSGRLQVAVEACDARELAAAVVQTAETHLPKGITLELHAPSRLPLVRADPGQLRQVLTNLVDNAVKYSPDGGPVEVRLERADRFVRFSVSDRGLGIPPTEQRRIFEKFYRLDPNMTRGIGGTGLGLYISRELVRRFDGRIWVESEGGEGSTFYVELPVAAKPRAAKEKVAAA